MRNDEQKQPASAEERAALWKRLGDLKFAMLTTPEADGTLTARPMTTQQAEDGGILWFFLAADGHLARTIARNPRVSLTYTDNGDNFYAALSGNAECFKDVSKARELWNTMAGAWFPGGPEDPSLALLRVDVEQGDTWEAKSGKLVQFLSIAKAAVTRTPPDDPGSHRHFVA